MKKQLKLLACCSLLLLGGIMMTGCNDNDESSSIKSNATFIEKEEICITVDETYNLKVMLKDDIQGDVKFSIGNTKYASMQNENVMKGVAVGDTNIIIRQDKSVQSIPLHVYAKDDERVSIFTLDKGRLYGKKAVFYGDSISQCGTFQSEWILKVADYYQLSHINYGISGTTLAYTEHRFNLYGHWGTEMMYTHESDNKAADYIFVLYGTNDIDEQVPVGGIYDMLEEYDDLNPTYTGAVNYAITLLQEQNPNVRIVWLSLIYRDGENVKKYNAALKDVCMSHLIKFIDMYSLWTVSDKGDYMQDSLHPNPAGNQKMFEKIINS